VIFPHACLSGRPSLAGDFTTDWDGRKQEFGGLPLLS